MNNVSLFFSGLFLCNAVPHAVAGLQGHPHRTPFAKPPGKGLSSPIVNVLWGWLNLLVGVLLLGNGLGMSFAQAGPDFAILGGALVMGLILARPRKG